MKKYKLTLMLDSLNDVFVQFCNKRPCETCPLRRTNNGYDEYCYVLCEKYPDKAAELMGAEIIESKLRLSEAERLILRTLGATYVTRDKYTPNHVDLWSHRPEDPPAAYERDPQYEVAVVAAYLFPSVDVGDCIGIDEVIESAK